MDAGAHGCMRASASSVVGAERAATSWFRSCHKPGTPGGRHVGVFLLDEFDEQIRAAELRRATRTSQLNCQARISFSSHSSRNRRVHHVQQEGVLLLGQTLHWRRRSSAGGSAASGRASPVNRRRVDGVTGDEHRSDDVDASRIAGVAVPITT